MEELNFYDDLPVNNDDLHAEADRQPILFMRYSELLANKMEEVNDQKKVIKVVDAEVKEVTAKLYLKYKNDKVDGKSPTESHCNNLILLDEEYKKTFNKLISAIEKLNKLTKQADILQAAVTSFQQRKNMLEFRGTLYQLGYNSEVKQKTIKESIHNKLNKG